MLCNDDDHHVIKIIQHYFPAQFKDKYDRDPSTMLFANISGCEWI